MRSTSNFFWRIISVFLLFAGYAINMHAKEREKGKPLKTLYGLSLDVDVLQPAMHIFNEDRFGLNADVQIDLWHKLFPTFLVGFDKYDASDEYSYPLAAKGNLYKVSGLYFKVGAYYNVWKKDYQKDLNPVGYIGINYAFAPKYSYTIENYPINNGYWNEEDSFSLFNADGRTFSNWGEVLVGLRSPIAKNFCLGFEVMFKMFLHMKDQKIGNDVIHQSYSPGFGDQESGKWGFRYTISYFFHL